MVASGEVQVRSSEDFKLMGAKQQGVKVVTVIQLSPQVHESELKGQPVPLMTHHSMCIAGITPILLP